MTADLSPYCADVECVVCRDRATRVVAAAEALADRVAPGWRDDPFVAPFVPSREQPGYEAWLAECYVAGAVAL